MLVNAHGALVPPIATVDVDAGGEPPRVPAEHAPDHPMPDAGSIRVWGAGSSVPLAQVATAQHSNYTIRARHEPSHGGAGD
jgi:hypothetical protein